VIVIVATIRRSALHRARPSVPWRRQRDAHWRRAAEFAITTAAVTREIGLREMRSGGAAFRPKARTARNEGSRSGSTDLHI
jgi:hypothetical protein